MIVLSIRDIVFSLDCSLYVEILIVLGAHVRIISRNLLEVSLLQNEILFVIIVALV